MNSTQMILTGHSVIRAKERLGIRNTDKLLRHVCNAWERGMTSDSACMAWQRKYMLNRETEAKEFRMYNGAVFVFGITDGIPVLITVYAMSKENADRFRFSKKKISHRKKYMRFHPELLN